MDLVCKCRFSFVSLSNFHLYVLPSSPIDHTLHTCTSIASPSSCTSFQVRTCRSMQPARSTEPRSCCTGGTWSPQGTAPPAHRCRQHSRSPRGMGWRRCRCRHSSPALAHNRGPSRPRRRSRCWPGTAAARKGRGMRRLDCSILMAKVSWTRAETESVAEIA